ncbi:MAG TPA: DUF4916 domain-containing protein [Actinomycetaceae bacterium]|nr:DUF4916 domain-containing protein [Actinomycetaceae bacterium]
MSELASGDQGPWLTPYDLENVRRKVPMVYVEAIPIRLASDGDLEAVGMLLRATAENGLQRSFVSGRVLHHETLREALTRHIEKDLGTMAFPRLPASLTPFTVAQYFPTPGYGFHDPRQHSVALVYAVPLGGEPAPSEDALDFSWFSAAHAFDTTLRAEMVDGHAQLLSALLAAYGKYA